MAYKKSFYKKKGPSKAESMVEEVEADIMSFWDSMADSNLRKWDKPWILSAFEAENAGKFINSDDEERYEYKGGVNQFIIALGAKDKHVDKGPLVINRTDMIKMFEVDNFKDTPVVQNGIKSLGSIFNRPVDKIIGSEWKDNQGEKWKSPDNKRPSQGDISANGLTEKKITAPVFKTFPVWSIDDIYDHLPDKAKDKVDQLIELRSAKVYDYDPSDTLELAVDSKIHDVVGRMGVEVKEQGNKAFYHPLADNIEIPPNQQFINPIERLGITMHELAHSTMHLLGRDTQGSRVGSKDQKLTYAKEEIIAQTAATIMVNEFKKEIRELIEAKPEINEKFDDFLDNSMAYNQSWGHNFEFSELVQEVRDENVTNKGIVKQLMMGAAKAIDALQNSEYTHEQRHESKLKNLESHFIAHKLDSDSELSLG